MLLMLAVLGRLYIALALSSDIALNKPSTSSVISSGGVPERGNDGDKRTTWSQGSCAMSMGTSTDPNAWWQVNLQADYYIHSVAITNRGDSHQWRLRDFAIKVYMEDPTTTSGEGQLCYNYTGTVASGETETLLCLPGVRGQYVRVQKNTMIDDDALQFCEVEVTGKLNAKPARSMFSRVIGKRIQGTPLSQESGTAAECGRFCFDMIFCEGFNFDGGFGGGTGTCQFMTQFDNTLPDSSYDYYKTA